MSTSTALVPFYRHPEKYDFNNFFFWDPSGGYTPALRADDILLVIVLKDRQGHGKFNGYLNT
jgi:hypothetical protein